MLNQKNREILLCIAKESVEEFTRTGKYKNFSIDDEALRVRRGAFVTLHLTGELRGCIGYIETNGMELWKMIRDLAIQAAFEDYRFSAVKEFELAEMQYEISILSVPTKIKNWQDIKLGEHGVIIKKGMKSGVFLPQVAHETNWDLDTFLGELCEGKAGLPRDAYKNDKELEILVFTAEIF